MSLAALLLLICAQDGRRSGPERRELARPEAVGSPAKPGANARVTRERMGRPRDAPRGFGFLAGLELAPELLPGAPALDALALPVADAALRSVSDVRAALFGYVVSDDSESLAFRALGPGTWDRRWTELELLATRPLERPASGTALFATLLVDRAAAGDDPQAPWSALTEFSLHASHRTHEGHGLALFAARTHLPELARAAFRDAAPFEAPALADERFGVDGWLELGSSWQLHGRAEQWSDRVDSGGILRARATWRDAFGAGGPLLLETYVGSGSLGHTTGLRASGRKRFEFGAVGLSWDSADHDQVGIDEKLLRHAVRADIDFALGRSWTLGLYTESQFGDERDALALGFALRLGLE